jgi:hypothetical protein
MSHATADLVLTQCPNCGHPLDGRYCAACGQKVTSINPTVHDFLHDLTHELLHVDGKIFQSVRLLLTKPGFLSREYFAGRRARYVSPIRLYLIFSVIYFAIASAGATTGFNLNLTNDDVEELRRLGYANNAEFQRAVSVALVTWIPRIMFVLVPLFAGLVRLATWGSGRNYPQHLYFALHIHAAAFAFLALGSAGRFARPLGWTTEILQMIGAALLVVHLPLAFRRAYGGTAARAIVRAAVVGFVYSLAVLLAVISVVLPMVLKSAVD